MVIENLPKTYESGKYGTISCQYFVVFCTKFARKIFIGHYAEEAAAAIKDAAAEKGISVLDIVISADCVHCIVECPADIGVSKAVASMKISAAKMMHERCPELCTRMPQLWTKKNFISSVGNVTYPTVVAYIENQRRESK